MNAYQSAIRNNPAIAREAATHNGSLVNKDDEKGFFSRPKSKEKADRERTILKYDGRKNSCPVCHTARSITGECALCD